MGRGLGPGLVTLHTREGSSYRHIWPPQPFPKKAHMSTAWEPLALLSPGSSWASTQDGAAEEVGRRWFAEKGLFYFSYFESKSWGRRALVLSGNVWCRRSFWEKSKNKFPSVSSPGAGQQRPLVMSHSAPPPLSLFLTVSFCLCLSPLLAGTGPQHRAGRR